MQGYIVMWRHAFTSEFNEVQVRLLKQDNVNFFTQELATLRELVGEDRAEFARQEASLYEHQQHQAYMGQDFTKTQIGQSCQQGATFYNNSIFTRWWRIIFSRQSDSVYHNQLSNWLIMYTMCRLCISLWYEKLFCKIKPLHKILIVCSGASLFGHT